MCEEAPSLDEYFAQAKPWEEPIFDRVQRHFAEHVGDMMVDPVPIGILLKNGPMFAELRAKTKWTAIGFSLPRKLESGRLSRKVVDYGTKYFHVINADHADVVDEELLEWLTEAYHLAGGTLRSYSGGPADHRGDGMVPDDVDDLFI